MATPLSQPNMTVDDFDTAVTVDEFDTMMKEVNELHSEKEQNALDGDDTDGVFEELDYELLVEDAVQPAEGAEATSYNAVVATDTTEAGTEHATATENYCGYFCLQRR